MISGNGYREFVAAFNKGGIKPGDDIIVGAVPPFKRGSAERKYNCSRCSDAEHICWAYA